MSALIAQHDWASTPLGPLEAWPSSLKTATAMILNSSLPMALLLGKDGVMIYNTGHAAMMGQRHPAVLGTKLRESWPELAELCDQIMRAGLAGARLALQDQEL